jgi:hypothetical protein
MLDRYAVAPPKGEPWDLLIVTTAEMQSVFTDYAAYKQTAFGLTTHVATMEDVLAESDGVDPADKLRNFIRTAYADHATQWAILGGDADGPDQAAQLVPMRCLYGHGETTINNCLAGDIYYSNLDGTWNENGNAVYGEADDGEDGGEVDLLAELYVGRIAADDVVETDRQIAKIEAYDAAAPLLSTILYGEKLWPAPAVWGSDLKELAYAEMPGFDALRLNDKDGSFTPDALVAAINSNEHQIVNASEHGNWYNGLGLYSIDLGQVHNQLPELANTSPFLGYSQGCYSGSFDNRTVFGTYIGSDCIAEELTTGLDAGAFAMVVNSREGFANWDADGGASSEFDVAFMAAAFGNAPRLGQALVEARETKIGELDGNAGANRWIFFDLNLLGDPHQPLKLCASGDDDDDDNDNDDNDAADDDNDAATDDDDDQAGGDDDDDDAGCGC